MPEADPPQAEKSRNENYKGTGLLKSRHAERLIDVDSGFQS